MNLKIKRMRELAGFFAQTVRTDGHMFSLLILNL